MMIDHVTANVGDFEQAKHFYAQALAPLGYSVQVEFEGAAGFGTGEGIPDFWIGSSPERGAAHVAFSASDRAKVDAFYEAAMAAGGKDNGVSRPTPALSRELLRGLRTRCGHGERFGNTVIGFSSVTLTLTLF
jgi:catechol 2,3-dioxygenase-like lactoylglutathione lyase family enzyme